MIEIQAVGQTGDEVKMEVKGIENRQRKNARMNGQRYRQSSSE